MVDCCFALLAKGITSAKGITYKNKFFPIAITSKL